MYKIMLVDRQEEIQKSIFKRTKWEELGFEIVGEAENRIEALKMIEQTNPDIMITEIHKDGIALIENVRYTYPAIKVILLSRSNEFEYAREAIRLGVVRYILKPTHIIEMKEVLRGLKVVLDEEVASKKNLEKLKESYKKRLPLLKEHFFNRWVDDWISLEELQENLALLDIELKCKKIGVAVIALEYPVDITAHMLHNKTLIKFTCFNLCEEIATKEQLGFVFTKMHYTIILMPLEKGETTKSSSRIFKGLEKIRLAINKYLATMVTIGVSGTCRDLTRLCESYEQAVSTLDYRITVGKNKMIYIEDIEPAMPSSYTLNTQDEKELLLAIKTGDRREVEKIIKRLFEGIANTHMTVKDYQIYSMSLISDMIRLARMMEIDMELVLPTEEHFFHKLSRLEDKKEIETWCMEICIALTKAFEAKHPIRSNELIQKTIDYVDRHFTDETLNAEQICKELHISTNYFSALFKKHMQMTFINYLTSVRIGAAKKLLKTTNKKTFEIAHMVGYLEGHYFSYVFKKTTGMSPTEYRNR